MELTNADKATAAVLAAPALPADRAGTPPLDARLARAYELLEAAHRLIVRGVVRPDPTEADAVFRDALEWRDDYAAFKNGGREVV